MEVLWITLDWSEDAAPCPVAVVEASLKSTDYNSSEQD